MCLTKDFLNLLLGNTVHTTYMRVAEWSNRAGGFPQPKVTDGQVQDDDEVLKK